MSMVDFIPCIPFFKVLSQNVHNDLLSTDLETYKTGGNHVFVVTKIMDLPYSSTTIKYETSTPLEAPFDSWFAHPSNCYPIECLGKRIHNNERSLVGFMT